MARTLDATMYFKDKRRTTAAYPACLLDICDGEGIVVFDIETTGFDGACHQVTVGGLAWMDGGFIHLEQYFAPSPRHEREALELFLQRLGEFECLCHYNGDQFDIPFLRQRARHFRLQHALDETESFDWLKRVRRFRYKLGLPNCKLQTVQHYLGLRRDDHTDGAQAVQAYYDWLESGDTRHRDQILSHNADDIVLMFDLMAQVEQRVGIGA